MDEKTSSNSGRAPGANFPVGPHCFRAAIRDANTLREAQEVALTIVKEWERLSLYALSLRINPRRFWMMKRELEKFGLSHYFIPEPEDSDCAGQSSYGPVDEPDSFDDGGDPEGLLVEFPAGERAGETHGELNEYPEASPVTPHR